MYTVCVIVLIITKYIMSSYMYMYCECIVKLHAFIVYMLTDSRGVVWSWYHYYSLIHTTQSLHFSIYSNRGKIIIIL